MSDRLKRSLSEVLTEYYPLAGRFDGKQSIDCNDDGLYYIEARVKAPLTLNQLVTCPKSEELDHSLPYDVYNYGTGFKGLSAVQVTIFEGCGGMAIGICVSHALTDASALANLVVRWGVIARGGDTWVPDRPVAEKFTFASLLPPRDMPNIDIFEGETPGARKLVTKRFIFPQFKIDTLKSKFEYQSPTRTEVVSALIFKCLIKASARSSKSIFPAIGVDMRSRASPPLPADYLGNMVLPLMIEQIGPDTSLNDLGVQIRRLTQEIDGEYLKKLLANKGWLLNERMEQFARFCMNNEVGRILAVSGCCNIPFYEVDFGWGRPALATILIRNVPCVVLLSKNRDGIEAWLSLEEDDMAHFESENELLHFTSPNLINCKL